MRQAASNERLSKKHISIPNKAADSEASAHFTQFLLSVQEQLCLDGAGIRPPSVNKWSSWVTAACPGGGGPVTILPAASLSLSLPPESKKIHVPQVPGSHLAPSRQPAKAPCSQVCLVQGDREVPLWAGGGSKAGAERERSISGLAARCPQGTPPSIWALFPPVGKRGVPSGFLGHEKVGPGQKRASAPHPHGQPSAPSIPTQAWAPCPSH